MFQPSRTESVNPSFDASANDDIESIFYGTSHGVLDWNPYTRAQRRNIFTLAKHIRQPGHSRYAKPRHFNEEELAKLKHHVNGLCPIDELKTIAENCILSERSHFLQPRKFCYLEVMSYTACNELKKRWMENRKELFHVYLTLEPQMLIKEEEKKAPLAPELDDIRLMIYRSEYPMTQRRYLTQKYRQAREQRARSTFNFFSANRQGEQDVINMDGEFNPINLPNQVKHKPFYERPAEPPLKTGAQTEAWAKSRQRFYRIYLEKIGAFVPGWDDTDYARANRLHRQTEA